MYELRSQLEHQKAQQQDLSSLQKEHQRLQQLHMEEQKTLRNQLDLLYQQQPQLVLQRGEEQQREESVGDSDDASDSSEEQGEEEYTESEQVAFERTILQDGDSWQEQPREFNSPSMFSDGRQSSSLRVSTESGRKTKREERAHAQVCFLHFFAS